MGTTPKVLMTVMIQVTYFPWLPVVKPILTIRLFLLSSSIEVGMALNNLMISWTPSERITESSQLFHFLHSNNYVATLYNIQYNRFLSFRIAAISALFQC